MMGMDNCDMCGKSRRNVEAVPSRSQLLFGGFNVRLERRCPACERKVAAWVARTLSDFGKDSKRMVGGR